MHTNGKRSARSSFFFLSLGRSAFKDSFSNHFSQFEVSLVALVVVGKETKAHWEYVIKGAVVRCRRNKVCFIRRGMIEIRQRFERVAESGGRGGGTAGRGARGGYFVVSTREGIAIAVLMICVRTCYTHGSS
jgi:hypothetical protein